MNRFIMSLIMFSLFFSIACSTSYKAKPVSFKHPESYDNAVIKGGAQIAARAFSDAAEAKDVFGFDVLGAGMLPVQVVFDNKETHPLEINGSQSFLEDAGGNLWPVLDRKTAQERALKYAKTNQIFKEGAYSGFLGAAAGTLIGAAIGVVSGDNVAEAAGKGAAIGAAAGATMGGAGGYGSNKAQRRITNDLREKTLQNNAIEPKSIAHGFLFFPGEAGSAKWLRLSFREADTGKVHAVKFALK